MRSSHPLQRWAGWASSKLLPEAAAGWERARRSADELVQRVVGKDFPARVAFLRERYAAGDPFGFDPDAAEQAVKVAAFFHRVYFRTSVHGLEHVPEGRVLMVSNHSGQIPIDGAIIAAACFLDGERPRVVRALVERWAPTLPFVSTFFTRLGHVVGVPENRRRLLEMGEAVLVFPEGIRGISKPITQRYRLAEFGRGFMRLALATDTPIVPMALVGAEEQYVSLGNVAWAARALNMPVFPLLPQLLVPGGQLPLPTKYHLQLGEALHFAGDPDDDRLVAEHVAVVQRTIAAMLSAALRERGGIFF